VTIFLRRATYRKDLFWFIVSEDSVHHGGEGMTEVELLTQWWPRNRQKGNIGRSKDIAAMINFLQLGPTFYFSPPPNNVINALKKLITSLMN
jgi:hypothetical protein